MSLRSTNHQRRYVLLKLAEAQNWRCCYCGVAMQIEADLRLRSDAATIEHVVPRSHGGPNAQANLVAACRQCNWERKNRDALEFFYWKQRPQPARWQSGVTLAERVPALAALAAMNRVQEEML